MSKQNTNHKPNRESQLEAISSAYVLKHRAKSMKQMSSPERSGDMISNLSKQSQIIMFTRKLSQGFASFKPNWIALLGILIVVTLVAKIECHNLKRTQYHEQGVHGPKSYKFGYTAGDYKNPQERHEVSDGHGHVKGWYSYLDATGKYQVVHYEAHPKYGFKVYNHKSKAYNNGKRHYNS